MSQSRLWPLELFEKHLSKHQPDTLNALRGLVAEIARRQERNPSRT